MKCNKQTRVYYVQLEKLMFKFVEWKTSKQLELKDEQHKKEIRALRYKNPESIYQIYDKKTGKLLYIGSDISKLQNRKYQHLTQRLNIIMAKYQLIDTFLATMDI